MKNLIAGILLLTATVAGAQEVPPPNMMDVRSGILCNTELELQTLLTGISLNGGKFPENTPEGCGRFVPRSPVPMMVTPKYWYETPHARTLVAHFYFAPNHWQQWGWVGYELNEDYEAPKQDEGA